VPHLNKSIGVSFCLAAILATSATAARAQDDSGDMFYSESEVSAFAALLDGVNHASALEGAGSRGSMGFSLGAGASLVPVSEEASQPSREYLDYSSDTPLSQMAVPKIYVSKGTLFPIDLSLEFGRPTFGNVQQLAAHVQWTIYEALARPALAMRGNWSRLYGIRNGDFQSAGADLLTAWGFLRYFTLYGGYGLSRQTAELRPNTQRPSTFELADQETSDEYHQTWLKTWRTGGMQIRLLPPFVTLTAEVQADDSGRRLYEAKICAGM
jgi:hypothetical protein